MPLAGANVQTLQDMQLHELVARFEAGGTSTLCACTLTYRMHWIHVTEMQARRPELDAMLLMEIQESLLANMHQTTHINFPISQQWVLGCVAMECHRTQAHLPASFNGIIVSLTELLDKGSLLLLSQSQLSLQTLLKLQKAMRQLSGAVGLIQVVQVSGMQR